MEINRDREQEVMNGWSVLVLNSISLSSLNRSTYKYVNYRVIPSSKLHLFYPGDILKSRMEQLNISIRYQAEVEERAEQDFPKKESQKALTEL